MLEAVNYVSGMAQPEGLCHAKADAVLKPKGILLKPTALASAFGLCRRLWAAIRKSSPSESAEQAAKYVVVIRAAELE